MSKKISTFLLTSLLAVSLGACGNGTSNSSPVKSSSSDKTSSVTPSNGNNESSISNKTSQITSTQSDSPIQSLTAKKENVNVKIDEQANLTSYYDLKGFKSLSTKQKKVTVTSSDPNVVSINAKFTIMTAVGLGTATITVVSDVDNTKSCTFTVTVSDCFFDRKLTSFDSSWDIEHEMDEENPYIKINTDAGMGIYIRNSDSLKWYVETEITIHSVKKGEDFPKFGIVASTTTNHKEFTDNKFYYYLDCSISKENEWTDFGVCEVSNLANWAWNEGITNSVARCNYTVFQSENNIGYNTKFKMGMVRDGFNCHLYFNGTYQTSIKVLGSIFGNYSEETKDYTDAVNCMAGFFSFNSTVTFSNYKFNNDSTSVDALIPTEPTFNEKWESD